MVDVKREFVRSYAPFALETEHKTGIKAVFTLAQAALETGWGRHLAGFNFFGVKAKSTTPEAQRVLLLTTEFVQGRPHRVKQWFRRYESAEQSFTHHAVLLSTSARYAAAMQWVDDPYRFAQAVALTGYATDPQYAAVLMRVIETVEDLMP